MKVVYIAGPFRAPTAWGIAENIRQAERLGLEVAKLGLMPLIPHANTAHFHGELPDEFFLDGTMELLRRSDAVMLLPDWERSSGARAEVAEAERIRIPVFKDLDALRQSALATLSMIMLREQQAFRTKPGDTTGTLREVRDLAEVGELGRAAGELLRDLETPTP